VLDVGPRHSRGHRISKDKVPAEDELALDQDLGANQWQKQWQNHEIKSICVQFFPGIAKINTREIQLPNFREIKYARKLGRIRKASA
jgi:hypothetical protein